MKSSIKRLVAAMCLLGMVSALVYIANMNSKVMPNIEVKAVAKMESEVVTTEDEDVGKAVERLLNTVLVGKMEEVDNKYNYVRHNKAYRELVAIGDPALRYMQTEFAKSNENGLKEYVMALACNQIMDKGEGKSITNGREWYYKYGTFDESKTFQEIDADYDLYEKKSEESKEIVLPNNIDKKKIDSVVSGYILAKGRMAFMRGEKAVEAHEIYKTEESAENMTTLYLHVNFGYYGFENGCFTLVSGGGGPVRMKVKKDEGGEYGVVEYKQALDGGAWTESIKEMFPPEIADKALKRDKNADKKIQTEMTFKAKEYLKNISRDFAEIVNNVEKVSKDESSNKALYTVNLMRPEFPSYIGSREALIKLGGKQPGMNVRCTYETECIKKDDNEYIVTLTKKWGLKINNKEVISTWKYKITGDKLQLIEEKDMDGQMRSIK